MIYNIGSFLIICSMALSIHAAPRITSIKWGEIIVSDNNKTHIYKDAKVWPTGSREWDWKETGTKHKPGIQIADLKEFIKLVDVIILTRGMHLVLNVPQETLNFVKKEGKKCYVGQTKDMVKLYNQLVDQGKKVGGLFHSTC